LIGFSFLVFFGDFSDLWYLGVFDSVEDGQALVQAVEAVVGVGLLEAEVQA
jgi:hypothetical protein